MKNEDVLRELTEIRSELTALRGQVGVLNFLMAAPLMNLTEGVERGIIDSAISAIGFTNPPDEYEDGEDDDE